jgi:PAS domain S-box-containing protein
MGKNTKFRFIISGLLLSFLLVITGLFYYNYEKKLIEADAYSDLKSIADEKTSLILEWRKERVDNTRNISYSPFFVEAVSKWLTNKNDISMYQKIIKRLTLVKENNNYENVFIASTKGNVLISLDNKFEQMDSTTSLYLNDVRLNKSAILSELYRQHSNNKIYLDVIAPLVNEDGEVIAILICNINPNYYLYPLIQSWPTLSKTAETLLIRKYDNNVIFLNELRHKKNTSLTLTVPLAQDNLPAVKALSYTGNFNGVDYRGKNVLADLRNIPGTNWYMVTKVDADEILAELSYRTYVIFLFLIILIVLSFSSAAFIYRSRQKNYYMELFYKEKDLRAAQEEFRTTLYSIGDAIITVTTGGLVKQMNPVAEKLTGWKENNASGRHIEEVFRIINEDTLKKVTSPVEKVLKEGNVAELANHTLLISKDGEKIPISDSGAPIKSENGEVLGVVLTFRDQSKERQTQKIIEESRQRFLSLFTNMNEGVALHELVFDKNNHPADYRVIEVNPRFEKILGINGYDVIGKLATEIYKTNEAPYLDLYSKVANTGKAHTFQTYFEGSDKYFSISVVPWLNNGFATIFSDITAQKRAEEALHKRVLALTQPLGDSNDISFTDLFNVEEIQHLQNSFANATGVASVITHPNGVPITEPSNFCRLCNDIIRKTNKGLANCIKSDSKIGCYHPDGPTVQPCLSGGLWDAGASISVGGRHIANWLIGQVRNEEIDSSRILKYADEIEADRNEFKKALDEVPVMSKEKFITIANFLFSIANELSLKAYQNIQQARFITERKEIEEELRLREENLSITLNSIGDAVISTNTEGNITRMNPVAEVLTGWKINEAIGLPLSKIFYIVNAETKLRVTDPVALVIEKGIVIGLANHTILIAKDGSERQIADSAAPIKDKGGKISGVVLVFSDVTKEYETYKIIQDNERFLKDSQMAGGIGSYMMDIKVNVWVSSEVLDKILGIDEDYDKSTAGWISVVRPDKQQEMSDYFMNEVLGKKQRFNKEYIIIRKNDGAQRWVLGTGELEFDKDGIPVKMVGTIQDITDRVKAKQELEMYKNHLEELIKARTADLDRVNSRLISEIQKAKEYEMMLQTSLKKEQELNELKTRFISTSSHEFRTPLTSILSSAELIKRYGDKWGQEKVNEHIDRIKYSVDHLTKLLDDVLTISRTDNGNIIYSPQLIDLKELCNEIIREAMCHSNNNHNFVFHYNIEKNFFKLDPKLIRFILLNLLSNAFKYSPEGGNVSLEIKADEVNLHFIVEDNGIGIPEEDRKHLFEPFHRGNNVNEIPGTGLGLSIVQKSVEIHSGQIKCKSIQGQGTIFTVLIPGGFYEKESFDN